MDSLRIRQNNLAQSNKDLLLVQHNSWNPPVLFLNVYHADVWEKINFSEALAEEGGIISK